MTNDTLSHKERTIQDILDEMTPEQTELQTLIVGAALEGEDLSADDDTVAAYDALPDEQKYLIDFLAGNIITQYMEHDALKVDTFLSHYGVKGMKWGIRNVDRGTDRLSRSSSNTAYKRDIARAKVNAGKGTLADAHLASLKSTGQRAINAFTGDKRFWRNMAVTAGIATGGLALSAAAPALMPAGVLVGIGASTTNALGATFGISGLAAGMSAAELAATGAGVVSGIGYNLTSTGAIVSAGTNAVTNAARAVRGNARVDKSYAELGKNLLNRQVEGSKATRKVLNRSGSINKDKITRKPELKQSDDLVGDFLAHVADTRLAHALEAGSAGPVKNDAPKGDGKGGGRKFDESKIKRDGRGQFSSFNGRPDPVSPDIKAMDAAWKNNVADDDKVQNALWGPKSPLMGKITSKIEAIKKSSGVDLRKITRSELANPSPPVVKATNEYMSYVVSEANKVLSSTPAAVSPSGTQRVQMRVTEPGTPGVSMKLVFVNNKLKHDALTADSLVHALGAEEGPVYADLEKLLQLLGLAVEDED